MDTVCVLVVDRQPEVRSQLKRTLKNANPLWRVLEARDRGEAVDVLIRERVTVLLADDPDLAEQGRLLAPECVPIVLAHPTAAIGGSDLRILAKPFEVVRLLTEVVEAIAESRLRGDAPPEHRLYARAR